MPVIMTSQTQRAPVVVHTKRFFAEPGSLAGCRGLRFGGLGTRLSRPLHVT
jgi:hypothetical protein